MRIRNIFLLVGAPLFGALLFVGCDQLMYPTVANVKLLNEANLDYQQGLQESTVQTMTDQHASMSPENQEFFNVLLAQNRQFVDELKTAAAGKAAAVKGPELAGLGGGEGGGNIIQWILGLFNLGWIYPFIKGFGKSRASGDVAALKDEVTGLKLKLATAAGADKEIPSDSS